MMRHARKLAIILTTAVLVASCAILCAPAAGSTRASYEVYVKTATGWAPQEQLYLSKYYETVSIDLSGVLPDSDGEYKVQIAQHGGIAAHIDYVALGEGSPAAPKSAICVDDGTNVLRKVVALDNDVADAGGRTIECAWDDGSSAPVLHFNANQELYTIEAPLLTPFVMVPELMMPFTLQNTGCFAGDGVPDAGAADFSDYWTPTSGHPWGYTYLWLRSDGEYVYAIMEVTADNTYDETGWARLYVSANGWVKDFRVDAASHEYGVDRFVYTATVPWQHMLYEFKIPLSEIGAALGDTIKIGFGSYGTGYMSTTEKWVWDPEIAQWVKELTANIGDTLQFRCTNTNLEIGSNLSDVRFWDILDCSLSYQNDSLKINGTPVQITDDDGPLYRFKPKVLHPNNASWSPIGYPSFDEYFTELCPNVSTQRQIKDFTDHNFDGNVSACDQIILTSIPGKWYHVDRVPYTLNLSTEQGTKYFDSELNWGEMNLSDPIGTEWLEVCCCKDRYTLIGWECKNCPVSGISPGDNVTMRNERTQDEVQYTVTERTYDLVVSREYEMDVIEGEPFILDPGENITIEYNATVVRCGVDNNTFCAKGFSGSWRYWVYSNEDKVTITVICPSGDAADATRVIKDLYATGEDVYALGRDFAPNKSVNISITRVRTWANGDKIADFALVGPVPATTDADGKIGINPPVLMWENPTPGQYHIIFDDPDGLYEPGVDLYDYFEVRGAAPLVTPLGLAALIGLLSIVAVSALIRRKKR